MVIFGLILLLLALAVVAYMWFATQSMPAVDIDYGFLNLSMEPFWLFVAGGITLAAATCGLWIMAVGTRSSARKAKEVRELRRQAKDADRRAERAGDRAELDRSAGAAPSVGSTGSSSVRLGTTSGVPRTPSDRTDGPILPRPERREGFNLDDRP